MSKKTFFGHFKYSMNSLGLPAPAGLFSSATSAAAAIQALSGIVSTYGTKVTVSEAILAVPSGAGGAAVLTQVGKIAGSVLLAYYVGACIGALAYATGQWSADNLWVSKSMSNAELLKVARKYNIPINENLRAYFSQGGNSFLVHLKTPTAKTPGSTRFV